MLLYDFSCEFMGLTPGSAQGRAFDVEQEDGNTNEGDPGQRALTGGKQPCWVETCGSMW